MHCIMSHVFFVVVPIRRKIKWQPRKQRNIEVLMSRQKPRGHVACLLVDCCRSCFGA
jgi:hypothetical protein